MRLKPTMFITKGVSTSIEKLYLQQLQEHLDSMVERGWTLEAYSTNTHGPGEVIHNFIWKRDD